MINYKIPDVNPSSTESKIPNQSHEELFLYYYSQNGVTQNGHLKTVKF